MCYRPVFFLGKKEKGLLSIHDLNIDWPMKNDVRFIWENVWQNDIWGNVWFYFIPIVFNDFHKTESHCNTLIILIKENMLGLKMSFQTLFDLI